MSTQGVLRVIGELKTQCDGARYNGAYDDITKVQIWFEGWLSYYPHIQEMYLKNLCDLSFEPDRIVVRAKFTDTEWTMWCLKHDTPIARKWFGS